MTTLPRISVVTPSFNQASFIEETIQSVLGQGYPNLEFIVMDGGSTDGTLEILKKYADQLLWRSEPDRGQAHAINKGLRLASGEILAYLNSDDTYLAGALERVARFFVDHPQASWLTGRCMNIDRFGRSTRQRTRLYKNFWLRIGTRPVLQVLNFVSQPATFWRRSALQDVGLFNEQLHYTMDYDYWLRLGKRYRLYVIHQDLACFRIYSGSKSGSTVRLQFDEELAVAEQHASGIPLLLHRIYRPFIMEVYKRTAHLE